MSNKTLTWSKYNED